MLIGLKSICVILTRVTYAPLMLFGFVGGAIWLLTMGYSHWFLAPLLSAAVLFSFLAERTAPYQPDANTSKDDAGRDATHFVVNEASSAIALTLIPILSSLSPFGGHWPHAWPLWLQVIAAILVADAGITIAHYLSHRLHWLWRFHAVHHSVERLYGFCVEGEHFFPTGDGSDSCLQLTNLVLAVESFDLKPAAASRGPRCRVD